MKTEVKVSVGKRTSGSCIRMLSRGQPFWVFTSSPSSLSKQKFPIPLFHLLEDNLHTHKPSHWNYISHYFNLILLTELYIMLHPSSLLQILLSTSAEFLLCFKAGNQQQNTLWELCVIQYSAHAAAGKKRRDSHRKKKHTSLMKTLTDFEKVDLQFFFLKIQ